jgi:hypothetical protein
MELGNALYFVQFRIRKSFRYRGKNRKKEVMEKTVLNNDAVKKGRRRRMKLELET